ncbi:MAG: hypothetical protein ABR612_15075, partial [Chromatocurvus sp.]
GWYHAMFGDERRAVELLLEDSSELADAEKFAMPNCSPAIEMAWAHRKAGNEAAYAELLSKCRQLLSNQRSSAIEYFELDYLAARIRALEGNADESIEALYTAIDKGWREWWTESDPLLRSLHGRAEYQSLMTFLRSDLERQKGEARALFAAR